MVGVALVAHRKQSAAPHISQAERNRIIQEHWPRVLSLARRIAEGDDGLREDLEDELIGGLVQAALHFDPRRTGFWDYAQRMLFGRVSMFFRKIERRREVYMGLLDVTEEDAAREALAQIEERDTERRAQCVLADYGLDSGVAVDALFRRRTQREAADTIGMSYDAFWRRLKKAKIAMREILAN